MSTQVSTAFVKQYMNNVDFLVQQKGSRLRNAVNVVTGVRGEQVFMDRIGPTTAQRVTSRHADSPLISTPHDRRRLTPVSYDWGDLIDDVDKLKMLIDPTSPYAMNAAMAMGRAIDDEIISAAFGTAYGSTGDSATSGSDSSSSIAFPSSQQVAVGYGSAADCVLSVDKLIRAREILAANEADDYDLGGNPQLYIVANARQMGGLLRQTQLQSIDYNTVRALVAGEINSFMGFNFIRSERILATSGGDDRVIAFHRSGLGLAVFDDINARISERPDKRFSTYVYYKMTIGATRLEEEKVVEILCDPSAQPS
jgi:hypothetical protein